MRKQLTITLLFLLSIATGYAQRNLVPDSSFEKYNYLPNEWLKPPASNFNKLLPNWFVPTDAIPLYFNKLCVKNFTIPFNNITTNYIDVNYPNCTNFQNTKTGNAYIQIVMRSLFDSNNTLIDEYTTHIQTKLIEPLEKNKSYLVSFYINRDGCSIMAVPNIGAYLSKLEIRNYHPEQKGNPGDPYYGNFKNRIIPHIRIKDSILTDTVNWIKISGIYKAKGGEEWITLGHFNDSLEKVKIYKSIVGSPSYEYFSHAAYYLEDVGVYETQSIIYPDTVCLGDMINLSSTFKAPFSWYSGSTLLSADSTYSFKATQSGYYILKSKGRTDTFYITVLNNQFSLGKDTFICHGKSIKMQVPIAFSSYLWNTNETSSFINVTKGNTYSVKATNAFGCSYTDTIYIESKPDEYKQIEVLDEYCTDDSIYTTIKLPNNYTYKWLNDNDTQNIKKFYQGGCYPLFIKDTFGCTLTDEVCVELCPSLFNIPNAFTPNGMNRVFKPVGNNIKDISLTIYNRWGEILYNEKGKNIGWDGRFKEVVCPMGIYIYIVTYTTYDNPKAQTIKGVVELIW